MVHVHVGQVQTEQRGAATFSDADIVDHLGTGTLRAFIALHRRDRSAHHSRDSAPEIAWSSHETQGQSCRLIAGREQHGESRAL